MNTTQDDGGPAYPSGKSEAPGYENSLPYYEGMSLRDWFARNTPHDEVCEMTYKHLSLLAQERLAGTKCPAVDRELRGEAVIDQQIAVMVFHAQVNAALRYISADAMLAARKEAK